VVAFLLGLCWNYVFSVGVMCLLVAAFLGVCCLYCSGSARVVSFLVRWCLLLLWRLVSFWMSVFSAGVMSFLLEW